MQVKSIRQKVTLWIILIGIVTFFISLTLSYFIFIPSLRGKAVENAKNTNAEIVQQIDSVHSFVQDYTENLALSVAQNPEILRYFKMPTEQNKQIASLYLNKLISYEGLVRCVMIEKDGVPVLDSLNKIVDEDYRVLESEWYQKLHQASFGRGTSGVYRILFNGTEYTTAAYVKNFYHDNCSYTYTVFAELNNLIYDINVIADASLDYYALVDTGDQIFHTVGNEKWQNVIPQGKDRKVYSAMENVQGGIRFMKTSINSKWYLYSFVSVRTIFGSFAWYVGGIVIVLLVFLLLTLIFLSKTMGRITSPIIELSEKMDLVAEGNLSCQVEIPADDEIGRLSRSFNKMTADLKKSLEIIAEKEKREQQAKFSLLISQIDPHFIYNTINSINCLARKGRCEDVVTVNSALICILQDRLRVNDIQITDSIATEMKVLEQYMVIQRFMYDGELKLIWDVDAALLTEQIPKNMIQPLVENSLFHGLIDEESGEVSGEIDISIQKCGEDIVLRVMDNGAGMEEARLNQVRSESFCPEERGKRIGLSNIRGRLYYLYGSSNCMKIESDVRKGTCITLTFRSGAFS